VTHEPRVLLAPVQDATRAITEQVVADEPASGSQHPRRLGEGLFPLKDVVQHDERQNGVE